MPFLPMGRRWGWEEERMGTTGTLAGVKKRFFDISLPVVLAVILLTLAVSLAVGYRTQWYYGLVTFFALVTGITIVIDQWPKLYPIFSIQDEELENAKITQQILESRLKIEEERTVDNGSNRPIYLKRCHEALEAVPKALEAKQFDLAWGLFHFVEETLLLLYEKAEVISQIEILATRAQEVPEGKREGINKVLGKARDIFEKDPALNAANAAHESEVRAYLKEALAAINHHRRLFHWHRGIYQTQVYVLMACIVPLLTASFLLWLLRLLSTRPVLVHLGFLAQIFVLGAIGGVVSLLLSERSLGEGVTSFYYGKIGLLIKPALGAVGAVIVYALFESKLLFHVADVPTPAATATGVIKLAVTRNYFYYALAFLSGFSERFFTTTVARLEGRLAGQEKT